MSTPLSRPPGRRPGSRSARALVRRGALALAGAALAALAAEGAASLWLGWRAAAELRYEAERLHCRHDPDLGWSHRPGFEGRDLYGPGLHLTTNAQGLRASRDYEARVPAGTTRVVCLGDSFTLGHGVGDRATWPARLEARAPEVEALNMGQAAYGLDQCYLWYLRDGVAFECDLLLVALIGEDLERMVESRALTKGAKPFLELEDGELAVRPPAAESWESSTLRPALRRLWARTALGRLRAERRPPPASRVGRSPDDAVAELPFAPLARRVLARLARLSEERGQAFAAVYLPTLADLSGSNPDYAAWLAEVLAEEGVPFLDLSETFRSEGKEQRGALFLPDRHYSPRANDLVARAVLARLPELLGAPGSLGGRGQ